MLIRYRLARPQDARAIGVLARRVTRRWILPEQPASAAASLLYGMGARVIRRASTPMARASCGRASR